MKEALAILRHALAPAIKHAEFCAAYHTKSCQAVVEAEKQLTDAVAYVDELKAAIAALQAEMAKNGGN